jgi:integral membrane protein (TIGR01906 family)
MHILRKTAIVLFIAVIPVFLIASSVRWVINFPGLYSYGFDQYNISEYTGIRRDDLLDAGAQIRDYFNNDEEYLYIRTFVRGVLTESLYNEREIIHMKDVKGLVQGVYRVQEITGLYMLAFAAVGFIIWKRAFWRDLARYVSRGGILTLALVVVVGLLSVVGFQQLFLLFHLISFSNDFWQLDPRRDYLIAMFPQGFFFDATMLIALSTIVGAILLAAVPRLLLRWHAPRSLTGAGTGTRPYEMIGRK